VKILAIDLGETTGYCLLGDNGEILVEGTTPLGFIPVKPSMGTDIVVIERPAYIGAGARIQEQYSEAIASYRRVFAGVTVKVIRPADWMPRFNHHPLPERGVLKTQHEKDAYRMAHWAQDKFGGQKK
jgi:hypothetical protein